MLQPERGGTHAAVRTVALIQYIIIEVIPTREYCFEIVDVFAVKEKEKYVNNIHSLRLRW